jgi:DNA helicase II / ATP-dependent DNA helicase PcrA
VTDGFTAAQQAAITAGDGPLGIVAGPGCGKSTTLAARIAHLVRVRGADPSSILVVTFTAEAARRLRHEVGRQLDASAADLAIHTLHAFGRKVIDTWPGKFGFEHSPTVVQRDEARDLLARAAAQLGWDLSSVTPSELAAAVDRYRLSDDRDPNDPPPADDALGALAASYESQLRCRGVIDFPAMLSWPLRLLRGDAQVRHVLQSAFRWLLVDECQDLSPIQLALVQLLAQGHGNLTVAGDPRQSIFQWLGADPSFLLDFPRRYPGAAMVTLFHNHRSTAHLVGLANAVGDLLDQPSPLLTDNPPGPLSHLVAADDAQAEAELVAHQIGALVDRGLLEHPGDAAVLYRTNSQADILSAALRAAGVPYRMHAHADLFGERVVRDLLGYLRLAHNPADRSALARVADRPRRGLARLQATLLAEPTTAAELPMLASQFEPQVIAAAAALTALVYQLHASARSGLSPARVLDQVLDSSGYGAWLERRPDRVAQLEIVSRFRAVVQRAEVSLGEWLDALAMGEEVDPTAQNQVTQLCTVHQAKGREWRAVLLAGVEEGIIPHHHALQDDDALDGELRLLYVALTRVRERLFLSYCRQRERGGRVELRQPSRWLHALPPELLFTAA